MKVKGKYFTVLNIAKYVIWQMNIKLTYLYCKRKVFS
jgi:hypothetical protein